MNWRAQAGLLLAITACDGGCDYFYGTGGSGTSGQSGSQSGTTAAGSECVPACVDGIHSSATCNSGKCVYVCQDGFGSCGSDPSVCETVITQNGNCGGCGVTCATQCLAAGAMSKCNDPIQV